MNDYLRKYDERHGGPWDRGGADSYYGRPPRPHYFTGDSYKTPEVPEDAMSDEEIAAYYAGYSYNEAHGTKK